MFVRLPVAHLAFWALAPIPGLVTLAPVPAGAAAVSTTGASRPVCAAKPTPAKPAAAKPETTKPTSAKPATAKPAAAKPATTKPAATKSVAASGGASATSPSPAVAQLGRAVENFRAGNYEAAAKTLQGLPAKLPRIRDHVLYLAGESEFFAGHPKDALASFRELERNKTARLASLAPYRSADCLWAMGDKTAAVAAYRKLLGPSAEGERPSPKLDRVRFNAQIASGWLPPDPVVGRFRIAQVLADVNGKDGRPDPRSQSRAARAFRSLHVEFPAHPLADEAARRAALLEPAPAPAASAAAGTSSETPVRLESGAQGLARAEALSAERRFEDAVVELERMPGNLPAPIEAERKYLLGMTKYRMRNDYPKAAQLLLAAAEGLPGDKAPQAAFHGTRALSRCDRDDEAIVGYRRFVDRYPSHKLAAEASFLAGWLDFNRGRFRQAMPSFDATLQRFGRSSFAIDAAWFTALGRFLLGEPDAALTALDRYARLAASGPDAGEASKRITYFRARALWATGKQAEARTLLQELAGKAPFAYYGIMARARLRAMGTPFTLNLPEWTGHAVEVPTTDDPLIARVDELAAAGLTGEAATELLRGESGLISRRGKERALALLLDRYPRFGAWRRPFQLADAHGDAALASAPQGPARVFWTAAYPRAWADLVDKYGPSEGNPDLFVHTIMGKESAYLPTEVSYADARGLMQTLPSLAARLAADSGVAFADDQLYLPEVSIRWGSKYTGALARKFRGNLALAAGGYNAGAGAVMRWCDLNGKRPLDEFIELVTYDQTRKYMKLVLAIYSRYHLLYKGQPFEPALGEGNGVPGCRFDPSVPDYIEKVPAAAAEAS